MWVWTKIRGIFVTVLTTPPEAHAAWRQTLASLPGLLNHLLLETTESLRLHIVDNGGGDDTPFTRIRLIKMYFFSYCFFFTHLNFFYFFFEKTLMRKELKICKKHNFIYSIWKGIEKRKTLHFVACMWQKRIGSHIKQKTKILLIKKPTFGPINLVVRHSALIYLLRIPTLTLYVWYFLSYIYNFSLVTCAEVQFSIDQIYFICFCHLICKKKKKEKENGPAELNLRMQGLCSSPHRSNPKDVNGNSNKLIGEAHNIRPHFILFI